MDSFLSDLLFYLRAGGWVMPPLAITTVLLWYGLGFRMAALSRGSQESVRNLLERYGSGQFRVDGERRGVILVALREGLDLQRRRVPDLRRHLDVAFGELEQAMGSFRVLSKTIIAVAPLLGLLGTVIGMMETFDSLSSMQLFSQTGGIAGGISQALITTQFGLAIAIPGLVVHGFLERRANRLRVDLAQMKDILCTQEGATEVHA